MFTFVNIILKSSHLHIDLTDLPKRLAEGDEQAYRQVYDHYWNRVYSVALSFLKSTQLAQDAVQSVFVRLWEKRNKLANVTHFELKMPHGGEFSNLYRADSEAIYKLKPLLIKDLKRENQICKVEPTRKNLLALEL